MPVGIADALLIAIHDILILRLPVSQTLGWMQTPPSMLRHQGTGRKREIRYRSRNEAASGMLRAFSCGVYGY